jgi:glycerol-3-phosphate dehydrogenase
MAPNAADNYRAAIFERLGRETFDLLIIGGGINGCGIARDAAMRGLSVALVEKHDFGSGTSGRSSRMIHGGLRYLEQGFLRLVFEASRERRILLRIAPHLVQPIVFLWPVYARARISRTKLTAGLTLYDLFSLFRNPRHERLSAAELRAREPALKSAGLAGGAAYVDATTDDTRLTLANALAAKSHGAAIINHAEALQDEGNERQVLLRDSLSQREIRVKAQVIVRAVGPWDPSVSGTKGTHIMVRCSPSRPEHAVAFLSRIDERVLFMLPQEDLIMIGTTDLPTAESPDDVRASEEEIVYLLESANGVRDGAPLTRDDVVAAWAGIRPLAAQEPADPAQLSREHAIEVSNSVIRVTGGKLTTYRAVAAEVVDSAEAVLGKTPKRAATDTVVLPGSDRVRKIAELIARDPVLAAPIARGFPGRKAELVIGAREELAATLGDLLIRRARTAFYMPDHAIGAAPVAADLVAPLLGWTRERCERELESYTAEVDRMFTARSSNTVSAGQPR